nr:hypothetical protein CFP56_73006 [Quercus suber]
MGSPYVGTSTEVSCLCLWDACHRSTDCQDASGSKKQRIRRCQYHHFKHNVINHFSCATIVESNTLMEELHVHANTAALQHLPPSPLSLLCGELVSAYCCVSLELVEDRSRLVCDVRVNDGVRDGNRSKQSRVWNHQDGRDKVITVHAEQGGVAIRGQGVQLKPALYRLHWRSNKAGDPYQ